MDGDPLLDTVVNGRYHVVRMLGEGGMSNVYEVQHVKLKRQFALKRLLPVLAESEEALVRFEREAALLASLHHPHVVEITDWDNLPDGSPFMVLEFLHGAHLRVRVDRGPLPWEAIARIGDQTMSALQLAHRIGITHRDLKPENIFISIDDSGEERVKLLDFGVSKMRGLGHTTGVHAMLGTPSYMSPEQAEGQTELIGPSTDVWAMGAILYELATGQVAFTGETLAQTVLNITTGRPRPIAELRPDAPPAFVELVDRAISVDPERRIVAVEELRAPPEAGARVARSPRDPGTRHPAIATSERAQLASERSDHAAGDPGRGAPAGCQPLEARGDRPRGARRRAPGRVPALSLTDEMAGSRSPVCGLQGQAPAGTHAR